ncbi:MAG: SpoIIE family protein phosphatase [Betaproteobacteria bacterium]|nr:SpoIIE family protein phosphatase [Betaproteobacteria bacterium]
MTTARAAPRARAGRVAVKPLDGLDALSRQDIETMLAVTRALAAPFDLPAMLQAVTEAACSVLHAERGSVWLLDAVAGELVLEVASDLQRVRLPLGVGLVGACAQERQPINVPDCYADPRFDADIDRASGFHTRCSLTLPLVDHQGALVGVMQLLNKTGGVFTAADQALAEALAAQCAVALTRVRMTAALIEGECLRQELELARLVQLRTLPAEMPEVPGYTMHGSFLPASLTGGDTYDLAHTSQGLLVVLGDATGHGIGPALSVTQMHAMLRMALRMGADLETAFRHVNDQLADTLADGRFVTAFIGLLDAATHSLHFISGGQGPILHFQAARQACATYKATSFPMGAMPLFRPRPPVAFDFAPGDILVLLSDGIFEFEDAAGSAFGQAGVEEVVRLHHRLAPAALADALLQAVHAHAGGAPQLDDITMVLLKREALA